MPQLDGLLRYSGVPFAGGKIEHHPHVPTSTLRAQKTTVLGHINKDHVIPELQLLERLDRLMVAAEAMDGQLRLAAGAGIEYAFGNEWAFFKNLSIKVEYLYTDIRRTDNNNNFFFHNNDLFRERNHIVRLV